MNQQDMLRAEKEKQRDEAAMYIGYICYNLSIDNYPFPDDISALCRKMAELSAEISQMPQSAAREIESAFLSAVSPEPQNIPAQPQFQPQVQMQVPVSEPIPAAVEPVQPQPQIPAQPQIQQPAPSPIPAVPVSPAPAQPAVPKRTAPAYDMPAKPAPAPVAPAYTAPAQSAVPKRTVPAYDMPAKPAPAQPAVPKRTAPAYDMPAKPAPAPVKVADAQVKDFKMCSCGNINESGFKFCVKCGKPL